MKNKATRFEEALARLEEIVRELEEGEVGLEESLARYREGLELHRFCQERLARVERELLKVLGEDAAEELAPPPASADTEDGEELPF
jgi:exodeoxyribonuclease VII small subunit